MNYLTPSTSITAAHWNDVFQAADAWLTSTLGGLSALFAGPVDVDGVNGSTLFVDLPWDRGFFFFDPLNVNPATLHPLAQGLVKAYFLNRQNNPNVSQAVMCLRSYDHGTITTFVNGLATVGAPALGVQKLAKPTWAAWNAAIYPGGFGSYSTANMSDGAGNVADNVLDCSLGVIRVGGHPVTFNDITTAEHAQPFKPIDVFIVGNLTWDTTNWDKYAVLRVHNCARAPVTFSMVAAGLNVTLAPGASRCFRKQALDYNSSWVAQGNYFHWMQAGDGRFLALTETKSVPIQGYDPGAGGASIFTPGVVADVMQRALQLCYAVGTGNATSFGGFLDPTKMWDASGVLNNASYTPQAGDGENPMPAGGYFAPLASSSLLGDLLVHRGKVLAFFSNSNYPQCNFTGFANLATALNGAGVTTLNIAQDVSGATGVTGDSVTNLEIYQASGNLDLVDLSSPLATFINAGIQVNCPAAKVGVSQTSTPKSLTLPWLLFSVVDVEASTNTTNYYYYDWTIDGNGNYVTTIQESPQVLNVVWSAAQKKKVFLPTNTAGDAENWISAAEGAGGVLSATNFQLLSTPFGPVLQWVEVWPLAAGFNTNYQAADGVYDFIFSAFGSKLAHAIKVALDQSGGNTLHVTRAIFLQDTIYNTVGGAAGGAPSPVWPRTDAPAVTGYIGNAPQSQCLLWNFPRTDQLYELDRWFYHDPALAPMMPDWSAYFSGSNWANTKYVNSLIGAAGGVAPWWNDALSQGEFNVVTSFYEYNPVNVDCITGFASISPQGASPLLKTKTGISAMRGWSPVTDAWGPFAAWLSGANTFSWQIAPDLAAGGAVDSVSLAGSNLVTDLENNGAADSHQVSPNALRCQCEQFNALASLVASQPAGRAAFAITGGGAAFAGYMPDGSNYFPVYNLGASALTVAPYNVSPGTTFLPVWPRAAFYAWQTPAGADPIATYMTGLGATVQVTPVFGTGSGSLSWISIADARTIYAAFGIPFTLDVVAYPVSWVADNTMSTGGYFQPDSNGAYLAASSYGSGPVALANSTSPAGNPSMSLNGVLLVRSHITTGLAAIVPPVLCVQREGMYDLCVSAIPQNYAYQADPASLNQAALQALGNQIIPIYADNTVERANSEATVVPGAGGAGQYDHVIGTGLSNAAVMTTPVEAVRYPSIPGGI